MSLFKKKVEEEFDEIDLLEPEPYRSSVEFKSDMEKTKDFYNFLQGKRDSFERLELDKPFTAEQAFRIISMLCLSKRFNFIPEWIEQCDICKRLYDLDKDGGNSTDNFFDSTVGQIEGLTEKQRHHLFIYLGNQFDGGNVNFCSYHQFDWEKSLMHVLKDATEQLYPDVAKATDWNNIEVKT